MLDPTATYRTAQVVSANRVGQIVLLYQGAIRFATQHLMYVERKEVENAHRSSMRAQEIVAELRGSLDLSAGPIAVQLDMLYDFVQRRLLAGNMAKDPKPTEEAITVLRGLLEAWQEIASRPTSSLEAPAPIATGLPVMTPEVGASPYAGAARR